MVAATNRDLRRMISEGSFREDLFYRLSMVQFVVPSLRDRREDLPLLIRHFLELFSTRYRKPALRLTKRAEMLLAAIPGRAIFASSRMRWAMPAC